MISRGLTYTTTEFFWFALPFFGGRVEDIELWAALPQDVKDCFVDQMEKEVVASDAIQAALAERLRAVRHVNMG
jgi:hypothetical protein